ncbi:MAG: L-ectoine synthase, partial [Marinobacter sp. T13-3]
MKIVKVQDIIGTEREVSDKQWTSRRLLLKKDGMGFSFHETIIKAGSEHTFWYKHHLEAVYCV